MQEEAFSDSSDSEEESVELIKKALTTYQSEGSRLKDPVGVCLKVKDASCLVCLSGIKRVQAVWSCKLCHYIFHLVCIQQWAKDGVGIRDGILSETLFPSLKVRWSCPACRGQYDKSETPLLYKCYCGKQVDPLPDPWLLAHSCGELCGCDLMPRCGHKCLVLCHPGPCPPCPKVISLRCFCGQSAAVPQRCGSEGWSCGQICKHSLTCGFHTCEEICHAGPCCLCAERILLACRCGKEEEERLCSEALWSCEEQCGRLLPCGHHSCQRVCHTGDCGECLLSKSRTCPCGKEKSMLDCSVQVPCCGDTCSKALACGRHLCVRQCHVGDCGPCLQMSVKPCRCGLKAKAVSCDQEFLCEARCQRLKQCGRHHCRRKCCPGNCPSCEQICNRRLGCKSHKCAAPCHAGRCYPCVQTITISCTCGKTVITVPCGRQRTAKLPRCNHRCIQPAACHHINSIPHHCHTGHCPPCRQICNLVLDCEHSCAGICHSRPHLATREISVTPWTKKDTSLVVDPCPPCSRLVQKSCLGQHETIHVECSQVKDYACGRQCGRQLKCGNHVCKRSCHQVTGAADKVEAGEDCLPCEEPCSELRHPDCKHMCPLPCHKDECPPCGLKLKFSCHCSNMRVHIDCSKWCKADVQQRDCMRSCNVQCSKKMSCGHCCTKSCHAGPCTDASQCKRKISIHCPCRRIKLEVRCHEQRQLECDEDCLLEKEEKQHMLEKQKKEAHYLQDKTHRAAVQQMERQLRPRKRKRKQMDDETNNQPPQITSSMCTIKIIIVTIVTLSLLFVMLLWWLGRG